MTPNQQSQLERYNRLLEISRDLASTLDLNTLLYRIVHAAADLCQAGAASILLYDHIKQELHFEVATNMENPALRGLVVPVEGSIAGWIVTNRKPINITNAQQDARHFGLASASTNILTTSLLGIPLITKDKVIGALEAINKDSGTFSAEDQELLSSLGAQAAIAIENSRLFQQSDLISELVHELRTPMASLNTAVHLLERPDLPAERRTRIMDMIQGEIARLSDLTTSFLDIARLESGRMQFKPAYFDLRENLEACAEMMRARAAEKEITIQTDFPEEITNVYADQDKIKQVALNLISNAIKYNFPKGEIIIKICRSAGETCFSVADTGPGISAEDLQHLFEKFFRVQGTERMATGTGLGLSICKRIVEAHRGRVDVTSQVGHGTTFFIYLPDPKGMNV